MNTPTDLSAYCQSTVNISVNHLVTFSGIPRRTLYDWWKKKPRAVELLIKGIKFELQQPESKIMDIKHDGLRVLVRDNQPVMTLSKHTFVSCHINDDDFIVTLHHKDSHLDNNYRDHTYRVPIEENQHIYPCLEW